MKEVDVCRFTQEFELPNYFTNEAMGGKLWVIWNMNNNFEVVRMSDQLILGWVKYECINVLITFVYAKCSLYESHKLWMDMKNMFEL